MLSILEGIRDQLRGTSELDFHIWNANWPMKCEGQDGRPWRAILYVSLSPLRGLVGQF